MAELCIGFAVFSYILLGFIGCGMYSIEEKGTLCPVTMLKFILCWPLYLTKLN